MNAPRQTTVSNWRKNEEYHAELDRHFAGSMSDTKRKLKATTTKAVDQLAAILDDPNTNDGAVIRAACEVLDCAGLVKVQELEITERKAVPPFSEWVKRPEVRAMAFP